MSEPHWTKRYAEEIVIGLLVCVIWAGVAWLFHEGYSWALPVFYGLVAACLALVAYFGFSLTRRIPRSRVQPSLKNIEGCVRTWLDNHKVMVKNDPHSDCYFRFVITLDSGCVLVVLRSKLDYQEYVQILCDLGIRGNDQQLLEQFSEKEKTNILFDIKADLARARVGYSGLIDPPANFQCFQRVPIYPTLTEFIFMSMVGNLEAARNLVAIAFLRARADKLESTTPPLASNAPTLLPPTS
jgi:hypothetical protein